MKLIVGLGNPGEKYQNTRHNLGFMLLDDYLKKHNLGEFSPDKSFKSQILKTDNFIFLKPQTFMNNSGQAVSLVANFFKIKPADIIICYDELDLPLGQIKIRSGGAAAGHHGVESIISLLGTDKFVRLRMGIGNLKTQSEERHHQQLTPSFVTSDFSSNEKSKVKTMLKQALNCLELVLEKDLLTAQNQFN